MEPLATLLVETLLNPIVLIAAVVVSLALISGLLAAVIELWEAGIARVTNSWSARSPKPGLSPVSSPATSVTPQRLAVAA